MKSVLPSSSGKPVIIGLAGPSGSGKSLLAHRLRELLGPERCAVFHLDHFYRDRSHLTPEQRTQINFDEPAAMDAEAAASALEQLSQGRPTELPEYDFTQHARSAVGLWMEPVQWIVVEGIFTLTLPQIQRFFAHRWYLDVSAEECLRRRVRRDVVARGRSEEEITRRYREHVLPSLEQYVMPQRGIADLILDGRLQLHELSQQALKALSMGGDPELSANLATMGALPQHLLGLGARLGLQTMARRLSLQSYHWAGMDHQGESIFKLEKWVSVHDIARALLKYSGLQRWTAREASNLKVEINPVLIPSALSDLDGFTLLQLSDLHFDLETGVFEKLEQVLPTLEYDAVVITGDYRNCTRADYSHCLEWMRRLMCLLRQPAFGILGNHDFIEMVPPLEKLGLRMLLNEHVLLRRGKARVLIAGIDDPHYYQTHNLKAAGAGAAHPDLLRVLLSHSPETYKEAAPYFDLLLCGHTHGGQLCLPGQIPLVRNGRCPRALIAGAWHHQTLQGYTARGTGCCGVPARSFCPPEVTLHRLVL